MPGLNKSKQYLFKNKLKIRRKSKTELLKESFFMMILGLLLLLLTYFIPQKFELFNSFKKNIIEIFNNIIEILSYSLEILIVLLICFATLLSIFLLLGSMNRVLKIILPKQKKINFR